MPLVFVHGVANRADPATDPGAKVRNDLFRTVALKEFLPHLTEGRISNPFWGALGAAPSRGLAAIPPAEGQTFGGLDAPLDDFAALAREEGTQGADDDARLLSLARADRRAFVETLGALLAERGEATAEDLIALSRYGAQGDWSWLDAISTDTELRQRLPQELDAFHPADGPQTFGFGDLFNPIRERLDGWKDAATRAASLGLIRAYRRALTGQIVDFMGDIFLYLRAPGPQGPIGKLVVEALIQGHQSRGEGDDRLVVIAHSMGGNIVVDLITGYPEAFPDGFRIDLLVTAGNQVGVFEEIGALTMSDKWPKQPPGKRDPLPFVRRWINVYDDADILGFRAGESFAGAEDFRYDTGGNVATAHSAYFLRPRWHERLAERIAEKANE